MDSDETTTDVLVAGAGCGGICAAVQAARQGARVLLVERAAEIGGTGVHSPVGLVCKFQRRDTHEPINRGLHQELFPEAYAWRGEFADDDLLPSYDHRALARRYQQLLAAEPRIETRTLCAVEAVTVVAAPAGRRIAAVRLTGGAVARAGVLVDGTADGHLAALAGAEFAVGRAGDGRLMPATLTFGVRGFEPARLRNPRLNTWGGYRSLRGELNETLAAARAAGIVGAGHFGVGAFPYPDGRVLLFNANHVFAVTPWDPASVAGGRAEAEQLVRQTFTAIRQHPAFAAAEIAFISPWLGVREGRRVVGDVILTGEDCLGEARFEDAVAAGAYDIDIHDPDGGPTRLQRIPNSQYYHIPYRCLRAAGFANLLLGSRCISGDFVAHSSYRVMSTVTAIGQAAGAAAALAAQRGGDTRAVDAAVIRHELRLTGQWTEGVCRPPSWSAGLSGQSNERRTP
jgi:hypothetical protein